MSEHKIFSAYRAIGEKTKVKKYNILDRNNNGKLYLIKLIIVHLDAYNGRNKEMIFEISPVEGTTETVQNDT